MRKILWGSLSKKVSPQATLILLIGFIIVLLQLGYIAFDVLFGVHDNNLYVVNLYRKCIEYILLEFVILVIGAFLFDMTVRDLTGTH